MVSRQAILTSHALRSRPLSSQALPHSHNSVHSLSPLSVCEISSKLCSLPSSFLNLTCYPRSPFIGPLADGYVLLNNLPHNSIKLLPSIIHFHTPYCAFQILCLQPISH